MSSTNAQDGRTRYARKRVEEALTELGEWRRHYLIKRTLSSLNEEIVRRFHAEVINTYFELRQYRDTDQLEDQWDNVTLWTTDDGNAVTGMDTLRQYLEVPHIEEEPSAGYGNTKTAIVKPGTLDGDKLLEVTDTIYDIANELGFGADVEEPVTDPNQNPVDPGGRFDE